MENYKEDYIWISNQEVVRLIDEEGTSWYAMNNFFSKILLSKFNIRYYRDSTLIKTMRIISYINKNQDGNVPKKTWFINEEGLKLIIKNKKVQKDGTMKSKKREERLFDACFYFGVETAEPLRPKMINSYPNIKEYNYWEILCIKNDKDISSKTVWKLCEKCDRYFPDNKKYYEIKYCENGSRKKKRSCKQCNGENFSNDDKKIQNDFKNGGIQLVKYLRNNQYLMAFKYLRENDIKYAPSEFYEKDNLIMLTKYIKNNIIKTRQEYNISNVSRIINIKPKVIFDTIDGEISIGFCRAKKNKRKPKKQIMTESKLISLCNKKFNTVPKSKINIPEIEPILGIIKEDGLHVICHKPKTIRYVKTYQFYESIVKMETIIKKIEGA